MKKTKRKRRNIYMEDELWEFASHNPYNLSAAGYIRMLLEEEIEMKAVIEGYYVRGETVYRVSRLPGKTGIKGEIFDRNNNEWRPINPIEAQFYGRRISENQAKKILHRNYASAGSRSH